MGVWALELVSAVRRDHPLRIDRHAKGVGKPERVYFSARIGAAAALTLVLVVLFALDMVIPGHDISPGILLPLLGAILALLGLEASALWRGVR